MVGCDGLAPPMSKDNGFTARPNTTSGHHPNKMVAVDGFAPPTPRL